MILIGERIQEYRKACGLNQEEFAKQIGVSRQAVSKWERDKAYPDLDRIVSICEILNISIDELVYGKVEKEENEENENHRIDSKLHLKNIRGKNCRLGLYIISAILALACVFCMVVFSVLLTQNEWTSHQGNYEKARVEKVYGQYTKAEVGYFAEDSRKIVDTVWLDKAGIREGDYIECYSGAGKDRIYIKYKPVTIVSVAIVLIILVILLVLTCKELLRIRKEDNIQIILEESQSK
ncbi:MAG: helix-turn-helix transcriptional regulator [Agathobacter sp.]|nr:helix-turn-helix transcriptional regulator [Agathobacter sp.]